jgi:hypothetical protein
VRANELGIVPAQRIRGGAANLRLHAADVSHECARAERRGDLADKGHNLVDRRTHHDQLRLAHCVLGVVGHGVAPILSAQLQPHLRSARP